MNNMVKMVVDGAVRPDNETQGHPAVHGSHRVRVHNPCLQGFGRPHLSMSILLELHVIHDPRKCKVRK